ncbi:E3 ubiquitin-protein ligase TRIM37-like [Topomyia yanbarensis]|uniref:E3 ubiquitin-protein ligase TRIM37-like n=1 Tax=Topomyia yanbarensis TaxID=2498891 RepID=UPI00273B78ED|nr:E3 ubiquitin-protein ligase TRIM37-like [Topomyia yanbarensis]
MQKDTSDSDDFILFDCCICHNELQDTQLCPHCSKLFCKECITTWLTKEASCPCCRADLATENLVKACTFTQIQKAFERHTSNGRNRCDKHKSHDLSLFCNACEECICTSCWFLEPHVEHRDQAVPVEQACKAYQDNLKCDLQWLVDRIQQHHTVEKVTQANIEQLTNEKARATKMLESMMTESSEHFQAQIEKQQELLDMMRVAEGDTTKLRDTLECLLEGKTDATTLINLKNVGNSVGSLREEPDLEARLVNPLYKNAVLPEPTVLLFRMEKFNETIGQYKFYESLPQTCCGFEWRLKLAYDENKELRCDLRLVKGIPGEYGVTFIEQPERKLRFELDTAVQVGTFDTAITNDVVEVRILVQQAETYADKCAQLEEYVKQLEKKAAENEDFLRYLGEYQSKCGSGFS